MSALTGFALHVRGIRNQTKLFRECARVTVDAGEVRILGVDVEEAVAFGIELFQLRAAALGQNRVARIAIAGGNHAFARRGLMQSIVTAETSRPVLVADVVRIRPPVGLHLREEIVPVNLLRFGDKSTDVR